MSASVASKQRHTRRNPCPVCDGHKDLPQGKGIRCAGFDSDDGEYCYCTREEWAGSLDLNYKAKPPAYVHKLHGPCRCGTTHGGPEPSKPHRPVRPDEPWPVHPELGVPDRVFAAIDSATGKTQALHCRWDLDAGKNYRWYRAGRWTLGDVRPEDLPLYGVPAALKQAPAAELPIVLTEGEPAARALLDHGIPAVSSYGADVIPSLETLVLLRGHQVVLWADKSEAGISHMRQAGAKMELLGIPHQPFHLSDGYPAEADAVDYFAAGGTVEGLAALLSCPSAAPAGTDKGQEPTVRRWPKPLDDAAYYGVLGTIAREMEPYIEADSAALLVNLVTVAGVAIGRGPHMRVGAKRHYPCVYTVNVGGTGDNKGDGWWPIDTMLEQVTAIGEADSLPLRPQTWGGMSTGEGLLWQVRDERREVRQDRRGGPPEEVIADPGVKDKRLLAYEPEFARVLAVMYREGNTLSMVLRDLYDGASVARSSPKNSPITATGAHFGMIGQIAPEELGRKLQEVELFNGFANRFLWVLTRRQHSRPNPPAYTAKKAAEHATTWSKAIARARAVGEVTRDSDACEVWETVYEALRTGEREGKQTRSGMAIEVCARAHVHVMRIAFTFAALDGSTLVKPEHQEAALAIWDYAEACALYLFGHVSGDPVAEVIYDALRQRGPLTRTQISQLFSRHTDAGVIQHALATLRDAGRARTWTEKTAGHSCELWAVTEAAGGGGGS